MPSIEMILTIGGYLLAGIVALFGYMNPMWRQRHTEADEVSDRLVNNLKLTVEAQEKSMEKMQKEMAEHSRRRDAEIKELNQKVHELQGRNGVLEDLFKGRDPSMKAFFEEAPQILVIAKENNELVKNTNLQVGNLAQAIEGLVKELKGRNL